MVKVIADEFLTDDRERKYYADRYSCCPPPLFIIFITLVEVSFSFPFYFVFLVFWFFPPVKTLFFCRAVTHDRVWQRLAKPAADRLSDRFDFFLVGISPHPSIVHPSILLPLDRVVV